MKYFVLNIILITISFSVFGQINIQGSKSVLDSLKNELEFIHDDSLKVQLLLQIADSYSDRNPDTTIYFSQEALQLAQQIKDIPAQMGAMAFIGEAYIYKGNLPEALKLGLEAIEMGKDHPVQISGGVGPNYGNLGALYMLIGNYDKALQYFKKMTLMGEYDNVGVAYGYYYLAEVYEKRNQLDSANVSLEKSYQLFSTLNYSYYPKIYDVYPPWYNLRSKIYLKQNKPELALNDLFTSLKMTLRTGEISHISNTYIDISNYYEKFNQPDSVIFYAEKAFNEANKISYIRGILGASEILAKQFESTDPAKALYYYKLATETRNKLYGAGNIQIMRDMIDQEEKKQAEIEATKIAYQNRLKMNAILGITFTLLGFAVFLIILFRRKQKAKQKIELAYDQLKSAQNQLVQQEKLASLGQLTAGIAHEIKNPLNFVNNFSDLSAELIQEARDEIESVRAYRDTPVPDDALDEMSAILDDVEMNLRKIHEHGTRADGIVKSMLQHSRGGSGIMEPTDVNALIKEYANLAFHGMRAGKDPINVDIELDLDEDVEEVEMIGEDFSRVILNLCNNAFDAMKEKLSADSRQLSDKSEKSYEPKLSIRTHKKDQSVTIEIQDNGPGIPDEIKDKILQPFFTTKKGTAGTGLGLSITNDIIKAHGGSLEVHSGKNTGTRFVIHLFKAR